MTEFDYSGTALYGHPLIINSFVCPDEKHIFSLKLPPFGQRTLSSDPSYTLSHKVNLALRTLVICALYNCVIPFVTIMCLLYPVRC